MRPIRDSRVACKPGHDGFEESLRLTVFSLSRRRGHRWAGQLEAISWSSSTARDSSVCHSLEDRAAYDFLIISGKRLVANIALGNLPQRFVAQECEGREGDECVPV